MSKLIRYQCFCVCDGQQEEMYLKHLARLLKTDTRTVVFDTKIGKPEIVFRNHRGRKTDKAAVFDYDRAEADFERNLKACVRYGSIVAYSNLNFDLWILLHKQHFSQSVSKNNGYVALIRNAYGLEKTDNIKKEKIINRILRQITLQDVKVAIHNAKTIRSSKIDSNAKKISKINVYNNPDLLIHQFIEGVFEVCNESL